MTRRLFPMLLVLAVFLVWTYLLVSSVRLEERAAARSEIMLDNTGAPVEVIWEINRGYRLPADEEREHAER